MKNIIGTHLFFLFTLLFYEGFSQTYSSGITMNINGYIVNLGGKIFFQPCEDSTKNIWQCLDNRSFSLGYFREDLYFEAIENIGDSLLISYYDNDDKRTYTANMRAFYCSIEVDVMFLDSSRFEVFEIPKHTLLCYKKKYPLEGFRVDNRVKKIIPSNLKYLRLMYNYYRNKGYTIPKRLDEYLDADIGNKSNK